MIQPIIREYTKKLNQKKEKNYQRKETTIGDNMKGTVRGNVLGVGALLN